MATVTKTARNFAKRFCDILEEFGKTQRQVADECGISSSAINRFCKDGTGSESHICIVLQKFNFKRRRIVEILADRRAELSDEPAKTVWKNFRYAFLNEDEYLNEICPFPLDRAYACTHFGIHILEVAALAKECGISKISETRELSMMKLLGFFRAFEEKFGREQANVVLATHCEPYPPVLLLDFKQQVPVPKHPKLINCKGDLLFGLPHLVIGNYTFMENGEISKHRNSGGIEFLYSLEGNFELTYSDITYTAKLAPGQTVFVLDARKSHAIKLAKGKTGRLFMVRYYPDRRDVEPGKDKKQQQK
jgi:transcriptional regulator with XRE-family HTH domain/quercetin dioxygenase-like cupin family protein